jgi:phosphate transport system substrate-binding protein
MKKLIIALVALLTVSSTGAASAAGKAITIKGSDTMVILVQRWAEEYMKKNPGVTLQVTGGGSGTGLSALQNGTTDVAMASRPMAQKEKEALRARYNTLGTEIPVAKDGIIVYVNPANPVNELSLDQLAQIYTGTTTSWSQVGGRNEPIVLYGRENSSGTYAFFKEKVLEDEDYSPRTQTLPGTSAIVNAISREPKGIGYGGAAYAKGVKELKLKKSSSTPAFEPNEANVRSGAYPLSRNLFFYTATAPSGELKKFIDWVLSPEGQAIVVKVGYFPVK